jgi:hypothetical protein
VKVTFANVARARPFVLTAWELGSLSHVVGRDVVPELEAMAGERFETVTMGQLMRALIARLLDGGGLSQ